MHKLQTTYSSHSKELQKTCPSKTVVCSTMGRKMLLSSVSVGKNYFAWMTISLTLSVSFWDCATSDALLFIYKYFWDNIATQMWNARGWFSGFHADPHQNSWEALYVCKSIISKNVNILLALLKLVWILIAVIVEGFKDQKYFLTNKYPPQLDFLVFILINYESWIQDKI